MIPDRTIPTTCPFCGVGCQIQLNIVDERITSVTADFALAPNYGQLCVKGRFGTDFVHHPTRLTTPLIRKDIEPGKPFAKARKASSLTEDYREATWDEALDLIADTLAAIAKESGGDAIGTYCCAKATNEDNYAFQKLVRGLLRTNNVDHCARLCHAGSVAGLMRTIGSSAMSNSIEEMENLEAFIVIGSNTTYAHPVIALSLKKAVERGAKLILIDPRRIELADFATLWLQQRPGTDVAVLQAMAHVIVHEKLYDADYMVMHTEGFEAYAESLAQFTPEWAEKVTDVPADKIRQAARWYANANAASIYWGMGVSQSTHGADNASALVNLAMLCGHIGKYGGGLNPLRGQNNVQGCSDMGGLPNVYPGYQPVSDESVRAKFQEAWGVDLNPSNGLTAVEMVHAAEHGDIRAFYIMGEDPMTSEPHLKHARHSLANLDFMVIQDIFANETALYAHVILPAASFAEKVGTFTNTERRVQRVRPALNPPGIARPDLDIICDLAARLEKRLGVHTRQGWDYASPSSVWAEVGQVASDFKGITYERIEKVGIQYPCPDESHPGTVFLFEEGVPSGRGKFWPMEFTPPVETPDELYPFNLSTGRVLFHWHGGTMTRRSVLNEISPEPVVEINPADAARIPAQSGDLVRIASRRGEVVARVEVTDRSPIGTVFLPFHYVEAAANLLTLDELDPTAKIPDYKNTAVAITPAEEHDWELVLH
ncbi:MAG: formate dehydrogenase subunit alpha [Caldilineales bacterium]|nr:formate dehydrogenase subunit alpha [Caldilineales bacterium]